MAFPVALLLVAAGGAALLAANANKSGGGAGAPPGGGGLGGGSRYDATLPPRIERAVDAALANETNPDELDKFAATLRPEFPVAAGALEARARALRMAQAGSGGVRPGDTTAPSQVSQTMTSPVGTTAPGPAQVVQTPNGPVVVLPETTIQGSAFVLPETIGNAWDAQTVLTAWSVTEDDGSFTPADVDGVVGPHTRSATSKFQKWSNGHQQTKLAVDGVPGPQTYAALGTFARNFNAKSAAAA